MTAARRRSVCREKRLEGERIAPLRGEGELDTICLEN